MKSLFKCFAMLALTCALAGSLWAADKPGSSQRFPFSGVTSTTASGNITLVSGVSAPFQAIDPNGSNRNVTLPSEAANAGLYYIISNVGSANTLVVKDSGASTIKTLNPGCLGLFVCTGATYTGQIITSDSVSAATVTTLTATTGNFRASGTAGTVNVYPTTASKGKITIAAVDSAADYTMTLSNASLGQSSVITIPDPGAATDTFMTLAPAQTVTGWKVFSAGIKKRAATQTVTDSTTFAADDTLSVSVVSAHKYAFRIVYFFTTVNSSGVKIDLNGGSATVSSLQGAVLMWNLTTPALLATGTAELTALNTAVGITTSGTNDMVEINGTFVASSTNTFAPRFAQNAETGAAESVVAKAGSYMVVWETP
jgi:hypothetical protein